MKKNLLLIAGLIPALFSQGQTITAADTLSTEDVMHYFAGDTSFTDYDNITGAGVTWDYSLLEYDDVDNQTTSKDTIIYREDSDFSSDYPNALYEDNFQTTIRSFFSNEEISPTEVNVIVHGFVFDEGENTFKFVYNDDPLESLQLPMALNDTYTDDIEGEGSVSAVPLLTVDMTGDATVTADGTGTLNLGEETYTDVIRIKTVEYVSGTAPSLQPLFPFDGGPVSVLRTSYVYYSPSTSDMPIFVYGSIAAEFATIGTINFKTLWSVDSLHVPEVDDLSVGSNNLDAGILIYPNPANSELNVQSENVDKVSIYNTMGQNVINISTPKNSETLDISKLPKGIYFVRFDKGNSTITKKIIIK